MQRRSLISAWPDLDVAQLNLEHKHVLEEGTRILRTLPLIIVRTQASHLGEEEFTKRHTLSGVVPDELDKLGVH